MTDTSVACHFDFWRKKHFWCAVLFWPWKALIESVQLTFRVSFGLSAGQSRADCVRSAAPAFLWSMRFICFQTLSNIFLNVTLQLLRKYKVLSCPTVPTCIRVESRETRCMDGWMEGPLQGKHVDRQSWLWIGTESVQFNCAACETHFTYVFF